MADKPKTDLALVREYFGAKLPEMRELSLAPSMAAGNTGKEAVAQLASGIRDGSLTY